MKSSATVGHAQALREQKAAGGRACFFEITEAPSMTRLKIDP